METKVVTPALERLVEANTLLSGLGFESSGLAAAHAVHNGLTVAPGTHHYLHGEKVAFGLLVQLVLEGSSRTTVEQVLGFSTEVGLPITLAEIGLSDLSQDLLAQIARRATAPGETIHNEPFEVTPDMVADAILAADALGRARYCPRATRGGTTPGSGVQIPLRNLAPARLITGFESTPGWRLSDCTKTAPREAREPALATIPARPVRSDA